MTYLTNQVKSMLLYKTLSLFLGHVTLLANQSPVFKVAQIFIFIFSSHVTAVSQPEPSIQACTNHYLYF